LPRRIFAWCGSIARGFGFFDRFRPSTCRGRWRIFLALYAHLEKKNRRVPPRRPRGPMSQGRLASVCTSAQITSRMIFVHEFGMGLRTWMQLARNWTQTGRGPAGRARPGGRRREGAGGLNGDPATFATNISGARSNKGLEAFRPAEWKAKPRAPRGASGTTDSRVLTRCFAPHDRALSGKGFDPMAMSSRMRPAPATASRSTGLSLVIQRRIGFSTAENGLPGPHRTATFPEPSTSRFPGAGHLSKSRQSRRGITTPTTTNFHKGMQGLPAAMRSRSYE